MVRICLTCGFWEVDDEVEPIALLYSNLGSYFYVLLILLCYARRRGLGLSEIHDRCEIVMVQLKVAT